MIEAAIVISIMGVVLFGALGIYLSKLQSCNRSPYSLDWFLTARNSQSWWSMAFAFVSASTGSWIFFLPSKYANDSDLGSASIILMMYAIGASYPILMIGFIGGLMVKRYPTVRSLTDYAVQRFGNVAANYIACVCFISNGKIFLVKFSNCIGG
jgi:cytochrome c biogenesis protein CcdA